MNLFNLFCVFSTLCSSRLSGSSKPNTIVFPEEHRSLSSNSTPQSMPIDLAMKISDISNMDEFFDNFVEEKSRPIMLTSARFGAFGPVERKAVKRPTFARCIPEQTTVSLKPANAEPTKYYHPSCTRVARCGGCCNHDLLSCQPTEVEYLQFQVVVFEYRGGSKVDFNNNDIVSIEQHKGCKCACRIKEEDCYPYQKYDPVLCECQCSNTDRQEKCAEESAIKLWDHKDCACVCREALECTSGFYFDRYTCQCVAERGKRYNATDYERINYNYNN